MPHRVDLTRPRQSLAVGIWTVLAVADAVLVARRVSGEFVTTIPGSLAFLSTALVAAASASAWYCYAAGRSAQTRSRRLIPQVLSVGVTVFWGWSISAGAAPLTVGLLFAIILLHGIATAIQELEHDLFASLRPVTVDRPQPKIDALAISAVVPTAPLQTEPMFDIHGLEDDQPDSQADDNQTLWLSRRVTDEGEQIEGWARVQFALGQRETIVHVSFCPPLAGTPEIETEDLDGVGLEIRVAAAFPFGARLAVRRAGSLDESHADRIGFIAQAKSANRAHMIDRTNPSDYTLSTACHC